MRFRFEKKFAVRSAVRFDGRQGFVVCGAVRLTPADTENSFSVCYIIIVRESIGLCLGSFRLFRFANYDLIFLQGVHFIYPGGLCSAAILEQPYRFQ